MHYVDYKCIMLALCAPVSFAFGGSSDKDKAFDLAFYAFLDQACMTLFRIFLHRTCLVLS